MAQTAEITIQYINQPEGRGPGSIKDSRGGYWKVWPDKLEQFEGMQGQTVTVLYQEEEYRGKPQYTILGLARPRGNVSPMSAPRRAPRPFNHPAPVPADVEKDDRIAVLALAKGVPEFGVAVSNGDVEKGVKILRVLRAIWHGFIHYKPTLKEELNDEIPSFEESKTLEETFD